MVIAGFPLGSAPGFSGRAFRILLDISQRLNSAPPFWDLSIEISPGRGSAELLGMLPAPQNSGRENWGSARADRNLKARVSDKNGISFAGSETLQMPIAAKDFCLSRAERVWDVICAIWDLLRCTEICKSALIEFSAGTEIYSADFSPILLPCFFLPRGLPKLVSWDLGSAVCALVDWDERGACFVGCSCHTVPSWSAANEVQDMLRLRARAAARPVQGMRRQQQLLRAPAAALLLQLQGVWRQQLLRAQAAAQPVQGVWPQQLLRARAPARLLQL